LARDLRGVAGGLHRVDADDAVGRALIAVVSVQFERQFQFVSKWRRLERPVVTLIRVVGLVVTRVLVAVVRQLVQQPGCDRQSGRGRRPQWHRQSRRLGRLRWPGAHIHFAARLDQAAVAVDRPVTRPVSGPGIWPIVWPVARLGPIDRQQQRTALGCRGARLAGRPARRLGTSWRARPGLCNRDEWCAGHGTAAGWTGEPFGIGHRRHGHERNGR